MKFEPVAGEHVPVISHARTWARLQIGVGQHCATRVEDLNARTVRDAIRVPLMPLAEWVVANWFFLFFESPRTYPLAAARLSRAEDRDWFRRHNLLFAREGFPLPDLSLARASDEVVIVKAARDPWRTGHYPVRFIEDCELLVPAHEVRDQLRSLVEAVLEQLDGCMAADAIELREAWYAIQGIGGENRTLSVRAAALGLDGSDPDQVDDATAEELVRLSSLPEPIVDDLLEVPTPVGMLSERVAWIDRVRACTISGKQLPTSIEDARKLTRSVLQPDVPAYQTGWDLAGRVREELLHLHDRAYGRELTARLEDWVSTTTEPGSVGALRGWVAVNGSIRAAVDASDEPARRWLTARALCMSLLGGSERLVTDAQSWSQAVSRAFATELIAPQALLRDRVQSPVVTDAELNALGEELGAPTRAVEHQLENHGIASVEV